MYWFTERFCFYTKYESIEKFILTGEFHVYSHLEEPLKITVIFKANICCGVFYNETINFEIHSKFT